MRCLARLVFATVLGVVCVCAQESAPTALSALVQALGKIENPEAQANILRGMNASLQGQRGVTVPADWPALYERLKASPNEEVRQQAQALAAALGGGAALDGLRQILADPPQSPTRARPRSTRSSPRKTRPLCRCCSIS